MSYWIVFAAAFVLVLPLTLLAAPPLAAWLGRRRAERVLYFPRRRPLTVPPASETAASIARFRAAADKLERELLKTEALTELESGAILRRRSTSRSGEPR